jgi:tetratricopeptide (TPR) repeat protein
VVIVLPASLNAQMGMASDPAQAAQAKSQVEFDAYLEILSAADAHVVVEKARDFLSAFPESELRGAAYQYQVEAFQQLNDFTGMLAAGEKALALEPDNVNLLLALAPAMATRAEGRPDGAQLLTQAESYARHALVEVDGVRVPHALSMEQWDVRKRQMQSDAHGVLGIVALQRGQAERAVNELDRAISLSPTAQGVQFLRLGLALSAAGKKAEAEQNFHRAAELGPDPVRSAALGQLKKLR